MNTKKILALALAAVLLVAVSVMGTMAYLVDTTGEVKNTFTAAGIDINLDETMNAKSTADKTENDIWTMQMIPGTSKTKDPIVSVEKDTTVDIYLYVKFENTMSSDLTFDSTLDDENGGWKSLTNVENVYWREVSAAAIANPTNTCTDQNCRDKDVLHWHLLANDEVSVANTVGTNSDKIEGGSMKWTAYAIQTMGANTKMSETEAWTALTGQEGIQ